MKTLGTWMIFQIFTLLIKVQYTFLTGPREGWTVLLSSVNLQFYPRIFYLNIPVQSSRSPVQFSYLFKVLIPLPGGLISNISFFMKAGFSVTK